MLFPDLKRYIEDARTYKTIPVYKKVVADFETPLSIFLKVQAKFLLESIERGENVGRYSIVGLGKRSAITLRGPSIEIVENTGGVESVVRKELPNPLEEVRRYFSEWKAPEYDGLPPFYGGAIGYLGYEAVRYFEDIPAAANDGGMPDGLMVIPEVLLVFDSVQRSLFIVVSTVPGDDPGREYGRAVERIAEISGLLARPLAPRERAGGAEDFIVEPDMEKERFLGCVERCKDYIGRGDIIQVVMSQRFSVRTKASPFEIYQKLRMINPSPYLFFLDLDELCLIGSSPEVMVRIQNGELLIKPIAGTRTRGASIAEDSRLAKELLEDPKERAEHLMLVDLARNDLGRVAAPGSVEVDDFMRVERFSHVMHIVSNVKAKLDGAFDVFDVIRATFPAGTLTGAPKIRAMEIIAEMETERRGPYGGMVFNLGFNGNLDSCITIRTIVMKDGKAVVQAGAGIVADSVAEKEYEETMNKAGALIEALRAAGEEKGHDPADR